LFNLAKHPEVQQKVFEEIEAVFKDSDKTLMMNDLNNLDYLDLVIKESLRLFPPVPFLGRKVLEDTMMSTKFESKTYEHDFKAFFLDGKLIPKGTTIIISVFATGHNEQTWKNPEKFLPERFEAENMQGKNICSFVAFGAGPRNCELNFNRNYK
jgi:cytochrome P450 family 4